MRYIIRIVRKPNILDALLPRTRQNILGTLLLVPERRWYLSDLAAHLTVSPSSLQRELGSLTEAGILRREADGNRVYYQADPTFPLLPELHSLFAKTIGLADKVRDKMAPFLDEMELALIFGSIARGERTAQSDVDLLVVGDVGLAALAVPLRELERSLDIPVNITQFSPAEFRAKLHQKNHFLRTILEGRKIFLKGSDRELANIVGLSEDQDPCDEQTGIGGSARRDPA